MVKIVSDLRARAIAKLGHAQAVFGHEYGQRLLANLDILVIGLAL